MQNSPKLIYNVATGKWLLNIHDAFWTFRSTSDALTLAGYLQVNVVDKSSSEYLVISTGYATVVQDQDFECQVTLTPLKDADNPMSATIYPETVDYGIVDCHQGFYNDLWVASEASMVIEDVRSLGLKFFLPEIKDHDSKDIECFIGEKRVAKDVLERGEPQEIWVDIPADLKGPQELIIKSSYKEPNATDERSLGLIFVEYNVNLTEWKTAGGLL